MKHKHHFKSRTLKAKSLGVAMLLFFGLSLSTVSAQQAITSTGGDALGSGGTVVYSVGQIDYTSHTSDSGTISQGVQQPYEIYTLEVVENELDLSLVVFPNPATDNLTLQIQDYNNEKLVYQLTDLQGRLIKTGSITNNKTHIVMSNLSAATYFLSVEQENNPQAYKQSFKIIKN